MLASACGPPVTFDGDGINLLAVVEFEPSRVVAACEQGATRSQDEGLAFEDQLVDLIEHRSGDHATTAKPHTETIAGLEFPDDIDRVVRVEFDVTGEPRCEVAGENHLTVEVAVWALGALIEGQLVGGTSHYDGVEPAGFVVDAEVLASRGRQRFRKVLSDVLDDRWALFELIGLAIGSCNKAVL